MTTYTSERESFRKSLDIDDFVSEARLIVQDFKCPLCDGIYLNPVVDACGHVYCKTCLGIYLEKETKCPFSGMNIDLCNVNKLTVVNDILERQSVLCKNRLFHCEWIGKLSELETHLNVNCARQVVNCPHIGCANQVFRDDLESHCTQCEWRIISCQDCQILIPFLDVNSHQEVCPKFKLTCTQLCGAMVERENMTPHINDFCENTVIDCPYKGVGCLNTVTKKDKLEYLRVNIDNHNLMLVAFMEKWSKEVVERVSAFENASMQLTQSLNLTYDERCKKLESMINSFTIQKDLTMDLKENINRENSERKEKFTRKVPNDSPKREKSESQSKSSKLNQSQIKETPTMFNLTHTNTDKNTNNNDSLSEEKFMNKKRQRIEEEAHIDINKTEQLANLGETPQSEKESMNLDSCVSFKPTNPSPHYCLSVNNSDVKKNESVFDMTNISKGVAITNTKAACLITPKIEHKYVFANITLSDEKEVEWRTVLNISSIWAAVGVCSKEQVMASKYRFITSNPSFNNATFAVSTNGYSWNCQVPTENNSFIAGFPNITKGDIFIFKYNSETKELHYRIPNKLTGKLTNVAPVKGGTLVPCLILLNAGDEISLESA